MVEDKDHIAYGRLLEQVDKLASDMHDIKEDMAELKGTMNKGWGIVIGGVAVLGMFATELISGLKRLIGIGG